MQERRLDAHRVAGAERAADRELELECREAATLLALIARRHPEGGDGVAVGGREAMDVVGEPALAEDVQLRRLHGVARRLAEARETARPRALLARRAVPQDVAALGDAPLRGREARGRAPLQVDVAHGLLDRGADLAVLGVEHLVTEDERVALGADDAALDVQDVADAQLALVAHVAVAGHAAAPRALHVGRPEPQRLEQTEPGIGDAGEVIGDGEVVVVVHLPAVHKPSICLEPAHFFLRRESSTMPATI